MSDKKYTSIQHDNAAGRVEFKGGKAVWEWARPENDSTSILIKSLDNPELELEKTQRTPAPREIRAEVEKPQRPDRAALEMGEDTLRELRAARKTGFDPYNRG